MTRRYSPARAEAYRSHESARRERTQARTAARVAKGMGL